ASPINWCAFSISSAGFTPVSTCAISKSQHFAVLPDTEPTINVDNTRPSCQLGISNGARVLWETRYESSRMPTFARLFGSASMNLASPCCQRSPVSAATVTPAQRRSVRPAFRRPAWLRTALLAGLVVALALIPDAIAFALIADVDPRVGLYGAAVMAMSIAFVGG